MGKRTVGCNAEKRMRKVSELWNDVMEDKYKYGYPQKGAQEAYERGMKNNRGRQMEEGLIKNVLSSYI